MRKNTSAFILCLSLFASLHGSRVGFASESIQLIGNQQVITQDILQWIQRGSQSTPGNASVRLESIIATVEQEYRDLGYLYVRVWGRQNQPEGTIEIGIDEGVINQMAIIGVDAVEAVFYRVDLTFPDKIFRKDRLEKGLQELREKYKLSGIYGEVRTNTRKMTLNPFGEPVGERELVVHVMREESFGWGFNVMFSPQWGLLPGLRTKHKSVFLFGDKLKTQTRIAIPYREYIVQENPTFQWVHGMIGLEYLFPFWGGAQLAPGLDLLTSLSRFSRSDFGDGFLLTSRTETYATVEYHPTPLFQLGLGVGTDVIGNMKLNDAELEVSEVGIFPSPPVVRYGIRGEFKLDFTPKMLREDHHSKITLTPKVFRRTDGKLLTDLEGRGQFVGLFLDHEINALLRGIYLRGDVQFWDERYLNGSYLRTHFSQSFWVREAIQLALGTQWGIGGDRLQLGVFHDFSAFINRAEDNEEWALANAFGPSVHYLFLDVFSLDVFYGFGFSPVGFGQSLVLSLKRVL